MNSRGQSPGLSPINNTTGGVNSPQNANLSMDTMLDNFCAMLVEEYLVKHNLQDTLRTYRNEFQRPSEVRDLM